MDVERAEVRPLDVELLPTEFDGSPAAGFFG